MPKRERKLMKIVVDAYGGDNGARAVVGGSITAVNVYDDTEIILVGKEDELKKELEYYNYTGNKITILNATEIIDCNEQPTVAIRTKKDSSLVVGLNYINEHEDDKEIAGFVSAGSTGAVLSGALFKLGRFEGIKRPALAPPLPNLKGGNSLLIDCGANMDSKPEFLAQFAIMGSIYMESMFGVKNPKVALLSVGVEDNKGNELTHEAFKLLKEMKGINFIGNIEARDIMTGEADVIVTDGFAGNVALKTAEGTANFILKNLKTSIKTGGLRAKLGALLLKKSFKNLKSKVDYNAIGGSPFLGCKRVVIKSHGSSDNKAIFGSISLARKIYLSGFTTKLGEELKKYQQIEG